MQVPDQIAKRLQANDDFMAWASLVIKEVEKLDTVRDLRELDATTAGQIAKSRDMAGDLLKEILKPVVQFSERSEHSPEEVAKAKSKYALG